MAGRASSPYFAATDETELKTGFKVKVKKPSSNSAREIRDAILREYFGYTTSDIKELDAQLPGKFYIVARGDKSGKEMSAEQVRHWKLEADGMISMTLNDYWLTNLRAFLKQQVTSVLEQAVGAISDSQIRTRVLGDLEKIFNLSDEERLTAVRDLIMTGSGNGDVANALGYLIAQDRYAENPFLLIARAKIDTLNYTSKIGPGYDTFINPLLVKAIKIATENFDSDAATPASAAISREEAAFINREAAWMFANTGKDKDFQERDWLARFYAMSEAERAGLQEGDTIHIVAPGANAASTPRPKTEAETRLNNVLSRRREVEKIERELDKGRGIVETSDPDSVDSTELQARTTVTTEVKGSSSPNQQKNDAFPRGQNQPQSSPGKTSSSYGWQVNQSSINRANKIGGAIELIIKGFNGATFLVRMAAVTEYIAEKERLESKIAAERVLVVPPKPAAVEKILADFRRHGRITANPFEKEKILKIISKLEQLRERSYAMWKEKK